MSGHHHHHAGSRPLRRASPEDIERARRERQNEMAGCLWVIFAILLIGYLVMLWDHAR